MRPLPTQRALVLWLLLLLLPGQAAFADVYMATQVASNLELPVTATAPAGDPRLFIVEVEGKIKVLSAGVVLGTPFLDLSDRVQAGGERGLLGLAFPPDYATSGLFYVNYTRQPDSATVLARFQTDPLLLYIGMGDGGDGAEAQNWSTPLGAMLRIDVSQAPGYSFPLSNPGVRPFGDPRIWAVGLRNPYRWSFDRLTGDLFIADVGESRREEVNFQPAASPGGENYGWNVTEGSLCLTPPEGCDTTGLTPPVMEYAHGGGAGFAVTGGYRHRGPEPTLYGTYFFADFTGPIFAAQETAPGTFAFEPITVVADTGTIDNTSGLGEGGNGTLYLMDFFDGEVFQLQARLPACSDGIDNDGDGLVDFGEDPGCGSNTGGREDPQCDDGIDNDGDGGTDWNGALDDGVGFDPQCLGRSFGVREARRAGCGLGFELALLLPGLALLRRKLRGRSGATWISSRRSS
jgi:hypothetical protein